jgi:hypothetical protein
VVKGIAIRARLTISKEGVCLEPSWTKTSFPLSSRTSRRTAKYLPITPKDVALLVLTGADVAWRKDPGGKSAQAKVIHILALMIPVMSKCQMSACCILIDPRCQFGSCCPIIPLHSLPLESVRPGILRVSGLRLTCIIASTYLASTLHATIAATFNTLPCQTDWRAKTCRAIIISCRIMHQRR